MKKILLTSIAVAACGVSAFGQGQITFENADASTQPAINLTVSTGLGTSGHASGSGLVVELFWNNGTSYILEDTYTSTFTTPTAGNGYGFFNAGNVTIPSAGVQSFAVEGFYTYNGTPYSGTTAHFTAQVNSGSTPAVSLDSGNWNGDITLSPAVVPEPATIALGTLGAAALLLFRRRK